MREKEVGLPAQLVLLDGGSTIVGGIQPRVIVVVTEAELSDGLTSSCASASKAEFLNVWPLIALFVTMT